MINIHISVYAIALIILTAGCRPEKENDVIPNELNPSSAEQIENYPKEIDTFVYSRLDSIITIGKYQISEIKVSHPKKSIIFRGEGSDLETTGDIVDSSLFKVQVFLSDSLFNVGAERWTFELDTDMNLRREFHNGIWKQY